MFWLVPASPICTRIVHSVGKKLLCGKIVKHILIHCWTEHRLSRSSNTLAEICYVFFLNISLPFPFQNKENWKCLLASTNVSALCLDFDEVSAILQALHIRALLSRSSGEMKFDSSSCTLKPVYFAFVKTVLEFFSQTTHFVKSRAHSPRSTSKIIAVIALRRAILMKANPVLSLHAHRLFRGRACSCKKDPCYTHEVRS